MVEQDRRTRENLSLFEYGQRNTGCKTRMRRIKGSSLEGWWQGEKQTFTTGAGKREKSRQKQKKRKKRREEQKERETGARVARATTCAATVVGVACRNSCHVRLFWHVTLYSNMPSVLVILLRTLN